LAQQLIKLDGTTLQWRLNLATSYANAANALKMEGIGQAATQQYKLAVAAAADLARRDQADPSIRSQRQAIQSMLAGIPIGSKPLSTSLRS